MTGIRFDRAYFSAAHSGLICRECESIAPDRIEVDSRLVRLLQTLLMTTARLPRLSRHQTDPLNRILAEHVEHTLSRRLRMREYVLARFGTGYRDDEDTRTLSLGHWPRDGELGERSVLLARDGLECRAQPEVLRDICTLKAR